MCEIHPEGSTLAPRPDIVLIKANVNKEWMRRLSEAGVKKFNRSRERAFQLAAEHKKQARSLGRSAFAIRKRREGSSASPEAADSGTPVFGDNGLQSVRVDTILLTELASAGFRLSNIYMLARDWKPPVRLVLEMTAVTGKPALTVSGSLGELLEELLSTCFGQVDVWANPRNHEEVVHTVNCGKRGDSMEPQWLRFAGGDWGVVENV